MSNTNNGGNAFPCVNYTKPEGPGIHVMTITGGMSLRDYFAAKAMQGFAASESEESGHWNAEAAAERAYEWADAMLKAREQQP